MERWWNNRINREHKLTMILLVLFAFLAGIVTILSPCILPILPIILAGTVGNGKRRPLGIVTGFVASFTFFTLFLSTIVKATGVSADALRNVSIVMIFVFGLSLFVPQVQILMETLIGKLMALVPKRDPNKSNVDTGFGGGFAVGISLGLLWTPCVGPILASVISLALSGTVTSTAIVITVAYSIGTAIPMFAIVYGGRQLLQKIPWLLSNSGKIQKAFGVVMILTAGAIYFNIDRQFQTYILTTFPNYGVGLTQFEDTPLVKNALQALRQKPMPKEDTGKPMYELTEQGYPAAPEIIPGGNWFNTLDNTPLQISDLKGKVVLVDFWTYTCINCIRTLPYLKKWHELYKDKGLVIIGVHTPEFEFEKNPANVQKAIRDFGITYPVVQDNNYATWTAYDNHYWPAKYLIDKNGKIRNTHFGEGQYDETESIIQTLLKETGIEITNAPENQTYSLYSKSPEAYLGYQRLSGFASPEEILRDRESSYTIPETMQLNTTAYGGTWTVGSEHAMPHLNAELTNMFESKEVFLVMRPVKTGTPLRVKILLDGKPIEQPSAGVDVTQGIVTVTEDRLYKLVNLQSPGIHQLTLVFLEDGVEVYAFTFG